MEKRFSIHRTNRRVRGTDAESRRRFQRFPFSTAECSMYTTAWCGLDDVRWCHGAIAERSERSMRKEGGMPVWLFRIGCFALAVSHWLFRDVCRGPTHIYIQGCSPGRVHECCARCRDSGRLGDGDGAILLHEQVDIGAQVTRPHVNPPKVAAAACEDRLPPAAPAAARHLGVSPPAGRPAAATHSLQPARHVLRLVPVPVPDARQHDGAGRAGVACLGRRGVGEGARVVLGVV